MRHRWYKHPLVVLLVYGSLFLLFDVHARTFEAAPGVSPWYGSAGLNFALVLLFGPQYALAIAGATLASGLFIADPALPLGQLWLPALAVASGNALAAVVLRWHWLRADFHKLRSQHPGRSFALPFLAVCLLLPLVVASAGVLSYHLNAAPGHAATDLAATIFAWWVGDAVGILTVAPFLLVAVGQHTHHHLYLRLVGTPLALGDLQQLGRDLLIIGLALIVARWIAPADPASYFIFAVPLLWIAVRSGYARTTLAIFLVNLGASLALAEVLTQGGIYYFQLGMVVLAVTALLIGALVTERRLGLYRIQHASEHLQSYVRAYAVQHDEQLLREYADHPTSITHQVGILHAGQRALANSMHRLQDVNDEKDRLISVLSHDLRNPLSGIEGLASVLLEEDGPSAPMREDMLRSIQESAHQAHALMDTLLDWARIRSGEQRARRERIDVEHLIEQVKQLAASPARQKEIEVHTRVDAGAEAWGDPKMSATILRNLLSNAVKFTPRGGSITIRSETSAEAVTIEVRDTGIGLTEAQREGLFAEPSSTPGTDGETGTGLGLVLANDLATAQGATIEVESDRGQGATFRLTLPPAETSALAGRVS